MDPYIDSVSLDNMYIRLQRLASSIDKVALALRDVGLEKPAKTLYMCGSDIYNEASRCRIIATSIGKFVTAAILEGDNPVAKAFDDDSLGKKFVTDYKMKKFLEALEEDMVVIKAEVQTTISGFSGRPAFKLPPATPAQTTVVHTSRGYPPSLCSDLPNVDEADMNYFAGRDDFGHGVYHC